MKKSDKTREQLLKELEKSNKRIVELEKSETACKQAEERNRLEREILDLTNTLNQAANRGDSLHEIIELLNQLIKNVFSVDFATVYLLSQDKEHLIIQNPSLPLNMMRRIEKLIGMDIPKVKIHLNAGGIYAGILQSDKPRFTNNLATIRQMMTECTESKALRKLVPAISRILNYRSVLSIPLVVNGEVIGLVDMGSKETFSEFDMKPVTIFYNQFTLIFNRKHLEEELKESELWSKEIFESSLDAIFIVDSNSYLIDVNKAAASLTGYSKDELLKMSIPDLHEEKDLEAYNKSFKCIMDGESITSEAKILRKDGTKVDVEFNNKRFIMGSVSYMHTIARDVTERKQVEKKIRDAEANLKNTFDISPGLICVADANTGYFTECNPAVTRILGFSIEEFTSRPFREFIHPDDRQKTTDEITKQLRGKPVANFENRYQTKDGSYKWLAWQATVADKNGKVYAVATDITERKQAEGELKQKMKQLERFNKVAVDRELRMIELKREINELLEKAGLEKKYSSPD